MTLLLLNSRDLLHQLPVWFRDSADELVVLSSPRAVTALDSADRRDLADRFRHLEVVQDYRTDALRERAAALCAEHRVTHILTVSESDIIRAAELRQNLGLAGQDVESAMAYRDKYTMKSLAAAAGIPVAAMRMVHSPGDLPGVSEELGYPLVLKRLTGRGSIGQHVLDGPADLFRFLRRWQEAAAPGAVLAEEWVPGEKFNVNGLMDGGKVVQLWPGQYLHTPWETKDGNRHAAIGMLPETDPRYEPLCAMTAEVIATLPAPPGLHPFHAEFFHTGDGKPVFCEIACRAGGLRIVDTHELSFGVNLYEAGLKGQCGRADEITFHDFAGRFGMATFVPQEGFLRAFPDSCPLPNAVSYRAFGEPGREYAGSHTSSDEIASVILHQREPDCLVELREAVAWWDREVIWDERGT